MAANEASDEATPASTQPISSVPTSQDPEPTTLPRQFQEQTDELPSSTPVELSHLESHPASPQPASYTEPSHLQPSPDSQPKTEEASTTDEDTLSQIPQTSQPVYDTPTTSRPIQRRQESEAIGPSTEEAPTATSILQQTNSGPDSGAAVLITLILLNGARHPYKIDVKYLRKRNVAKEGQEMDPFEISVYTMKELIWRDWREEWDPRPTIPGSIRLIHFGKLLDDKQTLKDCRFQLATPNVVHMTVRPQEVVDEEENAKTGKASSSRRGVRIDNGERQGGCCGCVIL